MLGIPSKMTVERKTVPVESNNYKHGLSNVLGVRGVVIVVALVIVVVVVATSI